MSVTKTDYIVSRDAPLITMGGIYEPVIASQPATKGYVDLKYGAPGSVTMTAAHFIGGDYTGTIILPRADPDAHDFTLTIPSGGQMHIGGFAKGTYTAQLPVPLEGRRFGPWTYISWPKFTANCDAASMIYFDALTIPAYALPISDWCDTVTVIHDNITVIGSIIVYGTGSATPGRIEFYLNARDNFTTGVTGAEAGGKWILT